MMMNFNRHAVPHGIDLERASDIPISCIDWLLCGWLARGKLHILAGSPSTGKTGVALSVAAMLSNGGTPSSAWPDCSFVPFGRTVIWTGEDGIEDTLMPRLAAEGANLAEVFILRGMLEHGRRRTFDFATDLPALSRKIEEVGSVKLVIIDSIMQAVAGDAHKNREVRRSLEPLVELAEKYGVAIIGITHVNKGSANKEPIDRVNGSLAFSAVARLVWMTAKVEGSGTDASNPAQGVLVRAKSNIGPTDGGFVYEIHPQQVKTEHGPYTFSSQIVWQQQMIPGTPKAILKWASGDASRGSDKLSEAISFLLQVLANGPVPVKVVEEHAKDAKISHGTLIRARSKLGVSSDKITDQHGAVANYLSLPKPSNGPSFHAGPPYAANTQNFSSDYSPAAGQDFLVNGAAMMPAGFPTYPATYAPAMGPIVERNWGEPEQQVSVVSGAADRSAQVEQVERLEQVEPDAHAERVAQVAQVDPVKQKSSADIIAEENAQMAQDYHAQMMEMISRGVGSTSLEVSEDEPCFTAKVVDDSGEEETDDSDAQDAGTNGSDDQPDADAGKE